ncbi:MAG: cyclopropane-fatty-acyl-phospholipid synthase family protein [Pseudomonadota bacterium]
MVSLDWTGDERGDAIFRSTEGQRGLPRWFAVMFRAVARLDCGALEWQTPDGRVFRAEGARPGPEARIVAHDPRMFGRILRHGNLGFCEAYMDGWWSAEPNLQAVMDVILLNNERVAHSIPGGAVVRAANRFRHWLNRNSKTGAKRNIQAHYDLSNAFYALWLDPSMTYSSALFESEEQSLEAAQTAKYASICDRMGLKPGDHVLEIGCGWGGFAEYAAGARGARVTGLTISPSQLAFAQARIAKAGLSDRVELVLRDYRDETGAYDGVASIEMFEAVGEAYWPSYFDAVRDRLKPGARASLQIITIEDRLFESYRRKVDFIQKYVFPGGMLPSPSALRRETARAGLEWEGELSFGESYSRTLRDWADRFNGVWAEIETLEGARPFDERFQRLWNMYLASCAACFRAGTTDVKQVTLRRA